MVASANLWVKFFQAAGVPSLTAASYAHIFHENRMELDMLMDLNKEYLREMGILPMGDIIAILRHSKKVCEQNAREKILGGEKQGTATVFVNPLVSSVVASPMQSNTSKKIVSIENDAASTKPARRVLPEHEGRYKVTLPSGTTERSKQILAKKALLYADQEDKKKGIFDRLEQGHINSKTNEQTVKVTGLGKPISSSIFSRLGGKSEKDEQIDEPSISFAGILKSAPKKTVSIKKPVKAQKVILVKKIPAKAATMIADEYESERMETGEKSVSFSTEDEILEIESRQIAARSSKNRLNKANNVRARLGLNAHPSQRQQQQISLQSAALLHRTRKVIKVKQTLNGATPTRSLLKGLRLKSDQPMTKTSVKNRLTLKKSLAVPEVSKLVNRIGRVSLSSRLGGGKHSNGINLNNKVASASSSSSSSVFNRLGFNKK